MGIVAAVLRSFYSLFVLLVIIRVILSWIRPVVYSSDNVIIRFIYAVTEPVLAPIRALLEKIGFFRNLPLDFSPVIAILLLQIIFSFIITLIS